MPNGGFSGFDPATMAGFSGMSTPGMPAGGTAAGGATAPSSGLWAKIGQWLGEIDPEAIEEELKYLQKTMSGFGKMNEGVSQSQIAQRLIREGANMQKANVGVKPYKPMPLGPTVTPEVAADMLRTMGLR
jgi:hypothetical protein